MWAKGSTDETQVVDVEDGATSLYNLCSPSKSVWSQPVYNTSIAFHGGPLLHLFGLMTSHDGQLCPWRHLISIIFNLSLPLPGPSIRVGAVFQVLRYSLLKAWIFFQVLGISSKNLLLELSRDSTHQSYPTWIILALLNDLVHVVTQLVTVWTCWKALSWSRPYSNPSDSELQGHGCWVSLCWISVPWYQRNPEVGHRR